MTGWTVGVLAVAALGVVATAAVRRRVDPTRRLRDPGRVAAVRGLGIIGRPPLPELDELAKATAHQLAAPTGIISLLDAEEQFFPGLHGLGGGPKALARGGLDYEYSYCKYVVGTDAVFEVSDSLRHPLVRRNPATTERGLRAYLGAPIRTPEGHVVGVCCVFDTFIRKWSAEDRATIVRVADKAFAIMATARPEHHDHDRSVA